MDSRGTPGGILAAHPADQFPGLSGNRGTSESAVPNLPRPEQTETFAVPCDDGLGPNDDQGIRQSLQTWDSQAQNCRSAAVSFGRFTERCRMPS